MYTLFNSLFKIYNDRPLLPWWRNFGNFDTKFAIIRLTYELWPQILHQEGVLKVVQFNGVI